MGCFHIPSNILQRLGKTVPFYAYTASRTLEDTAPSNYIIKARDADSMNKTVSSVGSCLKRVIISKKILSRNLLYCAENTII